MPRNTCSTVRRLRTIPPLLKDEKKGRADLKADEEDEERQAEVAKKIKGGLVHGEAEMTRRQRHEEHEGHAEGHAADLETAENGPFHK